MTNTVKVTELHLYYSNYDKDYHGTIVFSNDKKQELKMQIKHDVGSKMLELCADSLVETAKELSEVIKANFIVGGKQNDND